MNNIRMGNQSATDEQVIEAAKKAHCHEFIEKLPQGYQTVISEGGASLSGGERQRVAIARAIVRQPKILIADEPTGNLDPKHAWDVIRVLEKINRYGTTVILTTHNQDIVNKLKRRVITIDGGQIVSDRASAGYGSAGEVKQ